MLRKVLYLLCALLLSSCAQNQMQLKKEINAVHGLGDVYAQSGRWGDAELYYAKAHALAPEQPALLFKLADTQVQQGKLAEASATFKQLIKQSPGNKLARYRLAGVAMNMGDIATAFSQYQLLLRHNKQDYKALNGLGVLLDSAHKNKLAQVCYRKGLKLSPNEFSLLNNMGISYALTGNIKKARQFLSKSTLYTKTARPKNNIALIENYVKKYRSPRLRLQKLNKALVTKSLAAKSPITSQVVSLALTAC